MRVQDCCKADVLLSLEGKWRSIDKQLKLSILWTMIFGLVAHGYCYTNLLLAHDAVSVYYPAPYLDAITGRIGDTLIKAMRYNMSMPWLIGLVSLFLIGFACYFLVKAFHVKSSVSIALLCGIMVTFPAITCANLYIFCADQIAFAMFFSCLSVYLLDRFKLGFIYATVALVLSLICYQAYIGFAATALLLRLIMDVLFTSSDNKQFFKKAFTYLFVLVAGAVLYYLLWMTWLDILGYQIASYRSMDRVGQYVLSEIPALLYRTYIQVYKFLFKAGAISFLPTYTLVSLWVSLAFVSVTLVITVIKNRILQARPLQCVAAGFCILLLPLAMNLISVLNQYAATYIMMQHALVMPWIALILFCDALGNKQGDALSAKAKTNALSTCCALLASVLMIYNCTLGANISYVRVQINRESALSVCTRLIDRIEREPGYTPNYTSVAIIGNLTTNRPHQRTGYEWCKGIPIAGYETALPYDGAMRMFLAQLEPSLSFAYATDAYAELPEVEALDDFPQENCTAWVDGVLVIMLSRPDADG